MAENFKSAFAAARKAGKKVFNWNGKSYNTKLAPDATPSPKARPAPMGPKARPAAGKGSAATTTSPAVPPFPSGEKNPTKVINDIQKGNRAQRTQRTEARAARKAAAAASTTAKAAARKTEAEKTKERRKAIFNKSNVTK